MRKRWGNTSLGCYRHGKQPQYPRRFGPSKDMPMPGASHQTRISVEGRASKKCIKYMELSTRRMRKTNSRNKGASGERELARKLKEYGYEARRGQQYCGSNGDADVVGLPGIHIECKRVERLNLYDALAQSVADAKTDEKPTVFHRKIIAAGSLP